MLQLATLIGKYLASFGRIMCDCDKLEELLGTTAADPSNRTAMLIVGSSLITSTAIAVAPNESVVAEPEP